MLVGNLDALLYNVSVQDSVQDNVQDKKAKDITINNFLPLYSSLIQTLTQQVVNKLLIMWIS